MIVKSSGEFLRYADSRGGEYGSPLDRAKEIPEIREILDSTLPEDGGRPRLTEESRKRIEELLIQNQINPGLVWVLVVGFWNEAYQNG